MSRADTWMPLYIGDYLADTMSLDAREHGAYLLLIMHYWRNGPLPDDDRALAGIARVDRKTWHSDTGPIVRAFFELRGDRLFHKRIDGERAAAKQIADKKRSAAHVRWSKKGPGQEPSEGSGSLHEQSGTDASAYADASPHASPVDSVCISPYARVLPSPSPRKKEGSELRSGTVVPLDVRSDLFRTGLDRLRALTGKPESPCRAFLGRMLRDLGDDAAVCAAVLVEAERLRPADPTAWLVAAVRSRTPIPESAGQALRRQIDEQAPDMTRYFLQ